MLLLSAAGAVAAAGAEDAAVLAAAERCAEAVGQRPRRASEVPLQRPVQPPVLTVVHEQREVLA